MYRDQKPPESIVTTETQCRTHKITLSEPEAHKALIWAAMNKAGLTPTMRNPQSQTESVSTSVRVYESDPDYDGNSGIIYSVTITEDLSKPAIADFAPPNIEEIVRLNPPATPGLGHRQINDAHPAGKTVRGTNANFRAMDDDLASVVVQAKSRALKEPTSFEVTSPLNTTGTSSRENIAAIERMKEEQPALLKARDINARYTEIKTGIPRDLWMEDLMKRVNKLHEVLVHGKGHNIVLSRGEVDTLLKYINVGVLALDKAKTADA
jgi:hypothetical protein